MTEEHNSQLDYARLLAFADAIEKLKWSLLCDDEMPAAEDHVLDALDHLSIARRCLKRAASASLKG